jgi:hypothetical protein
MRNVRSFVILEAACRVTVFRRERPARKLKGSVYTLAPAAAILRDSYLKV